MKSQENNEFLSCLGFNLEDFDLNFYNKFFTMDSAYRKVTPADNCEQIESDFKKGFYEQLSTVEGGITKKNFKQIIA